jgi:hypothetical protein
MTRTYRDDVLASRRLAMLRLIKGQDGCNESILHIGIHRLGFRNTSRAEVVEDMTWLEERKLVTTEIIEETVLVATITQRGRDAAAGRGASVPGLEQPEL